VIYELFPNYAPRPPWPRKVGGHDPQLLWERRPCELRSVYGVSPLPKIISKCCELMKLCHINRRLPVFFETHCKDLNFLSFRLECPIHAPKFQLLGVLPQNLWAHRSYPQKALPCAERRVLSPHWSRSDAQCDLWPWQRKQKKEKKTRT